MLVFSGCSQDSSNVSKNEQTSSNDSIVSDMNPNITEDSKLEASTIHENEQTLNHDSVVNDTDTNKTDGSKLEVPPFDQKLYNTAYSYNEEGQFYCEIESIVEDTAKLDELFGNPISVESVPSEGDDYTEIRTYKDISIYRWDPMRSPYESQGLIGIEAWGVGIPIFRNLKIGDMLEDITSRFLSNDDTPEKEWREEEYEYLYYVDRFSYARIELDDPYFHLDMLVVQDYGLRYRIYLDENGTIIRYAVNSTF
jgi:hypothetical protein